MNPPNPSRPASHRVRRSPLRPRWLASPLWPARLAILLAGALVCAALGSAVTAAADTPPDVTVSIPGPVILHHDRDDRVNVGQNSDLPAGEHAHSVVAVFGSASSEGDASGDVVSFLGNTRVTGTGTHDAVAVLGNTYVDTHIDGDAVAVMGTVRLGPNADVEGDVTAVGGSVERAPGAIVHGGVQQVAAGRATVGAAGLYWLRPWMRHALLYLRLLGWGPGLGWAWAVALAFLALYVFLALLAPAGITACERTLRQHPGGTVLAAILTVLVLPFACLALLVSVIGIAALPALALALLCAGLFGKAVALAWLGRACLGGTRAGAAGVPAHRPGYPALAVLVGAVIALALYLVPVLGFVAYKVLGLLGFGAVIYTLVLAAQARRSGRAAGVPGGPPPAAPALAAAPAAPVAPVAPGAAPDVAPGPAASAASAAPASTASMRPPGSDPHATAALAATLPRAGFWIRMAALLLDAILIGIMVHELPHSHNLELLALAIYGAVMWKLRGATIGGIVFDLQVVRLDGREIDWTTAIVRALGCFLSLVIAGLGFIWIAFDDAKQAWHDKFAGTVVVRLARAAQPL